MKKYTYSVFLILFAFLSTNSFAQSLDTYQLDNGLTVVLDSDPNQNDVFGTVVVNAGSKDEKPNATGLAHYLEHMLFKGTETLGSADWEKEKPLLEAIDKQYDLLQKAGSDEEIDAIQKKINELTIEAAQYAIPNEFTKIIQEMGGVGMNATTSYDRTNYFNTFPSNQLSKWLEVYAHRFQSPVFRLFQPELEVVYEEKNRASDNPYTEFSNQYMATIFDGHPYERPIIGETDHLKKPNMAEMKEFFETWYVPNNMALIISGNFDAEQAKPLIEKTFGVLEAKELPARVNPELATFKGRQEKKVKLTSYLVGNMNFRAPNQFSKEGVTMQVLANALSNRGNYGLLDQLSIDGEVTSLGAYNQSLKDASVFTIEMVPLFDRNQNRQLSFKLTEKLVNAKLDQLKKGDISDELIKNSKADLLRGLSLSMESPQGRASYFTQLFVNGKDPNYLVDYVNTLKSVTKDDVVAVANEYLGKDYLAFLSYKGKADKESLKKPDLNPIKAVKHDPSTFYNHITSVETTAPEYKSIDFDNDVATVDFQEGVELHYVPNKTNRIFSMEIVFGAGKLEYPMVKYAVPVMNRAGVLGMYDSNQIKQEFAKLGINYSFGYDESYTYVTLWGDERNLSQGLSLLSKLMLLPDIEDKAFDGIVGNEVLSRLFSEKESVQAKSAALQEYMMYGDNSAFIDRLKAEDLWTMRPTELIADFNKAISHEADIHYYGRNSLDDVLFIMKNNLALSAERKPTTGPQHREMTDTDKTTIYLVEDNDSRQTQVYLFSKLDPISLEDRAKAIAFNQYFSGGFNGLMMQEIREYRALAYTAGARLGAPIKPDWDAYLSGYIGTQSDKTNDVVAVVNSLLADMPENEAAFTSLKSYLLNSAQISNPSPRSLSRNVEVWKTMGYDKAPTEMNLGVYNKLTFGDIVSFYQKNLKGSPYSIGVLGKISDIDKKELEKYGTVKRVSVNNLFDERDN